MGGTAPQGPQVTLAPRAPHLRRVRFLVEVADPSNQESFAVQRVPLEVVGLEPGAKPVWLDAIGVAGGPEGYAFGEVELKPGAYRVAPRLPSEHRSVRFEVIPHPAPLISYCPHVTGTPSQFQPTSFFDPEGKLAFGDNVVTLQSCCRSQFQEWRSHSPKHYALSLYVPLNGEARLVIEGKTWRVRRGEYIMANPVQSACGPADDQRWPIRVWQFLAFPPALRVFRETMGLPRALGPFDFVQGPRRISRGLQSALDVWRQGTEWVESFARERIAQTACQSLLMFLFQEHPSGLRQRMERTSRERLQDPRLLAAVEYMNRHLEKEVNISQLAREIGVSDDWLRKNFHEAFRQSPVWYLQALRVHKAVTLLKNPSTTVQEVAKAVGYRSVPSFYRVFIAHTSKTPRGENIS